MDLDNQEIIENLFHDGKYNSLPDLVSHLHFLLYDNLQTSDAITSDLVDIEFLEEIRVLVRQGYSALYFGKSLRDLKCVIIDELNNREHSAFIRYEGPKKLFVTDASMPHTNLQNKEYPSMKDVVSTFMEHINSLSSYFYELDRIDRFCTVMEPVKASFRDDYRRILLDDKTWLHVEVTPKGFATNIHLVGQSEHMQDKLQAGLVNWDHDKDIVENITTVFDIINFPVQEKSPPPLEAVSPPEDTVCSICLCSELADAPGVPQPLCQNPQCVVYFHRSCLFQWLVACSGGRPPMFGVASGNCPTCFHPTTCSEKDN